MPLRSRPCTRIAKPLQLSHDKPAAVIATHLMGLDNDAGPKFMQEFLVLENFHFRTLYITFDKINSFKTMHSSYFRKGPTWNSDQVAPRRTQDTVKPRTHTPLRGEKNPITVTPSGGKH